MNKRGLRLLRKGVFMSVLDNSELHMRINKDAKIEENAAEAGRTFLSAVFISGGRYF
jgi:hypothetical protein